MAEGKFNKEEFNNVCESFMDKVLDNYDVPGVQVGVSVEIHPIRQREDTATFLRKIR